MQAASLEKLDNARTLAEQFASARHSQTPHQNKKAEVPAELTQPSQPLARQDTLAKTTETTQSPVTNEPQIASKNKKIKLGAHYQPNVRPHQPSITAFEVAHWRNRLWLNPFLALSALVWLPFIAGVFTENLWINLLVLSTLSFIEYRLTLRTCKALHTVKTPLWQRSWLMYNLRRVMVISMMLMLFVLAIPYESMFIIGYLAILALYTLSQVVVFKQRHQQRQQQFVRLA
ncbi:hypothetical protein [Thiosulfatimonas sediminis]|nr:hypothetical protein [Thiosulfatimonas sediminis]